jgi:glycosyltransferase involved in cell wall biosynthesis
MHLKNQLDSVKMPFVSVIVPIYNVEKYLPECLDSIQKQTYQNLEIILIDDGSTDSSGKIVDNFARKEKRAKVFHVENSGIGEARNIGISHVTSPYLTFVDSDDVLTPLFIKNHIEAILSTGASISKGHFATWKKDLVQERIYSWKVVSDSEIIEVNHYEYDDTVSVWGNIYSSDLFLKMQIRFSTKLYGEDFEVFFQILHAAEKVVFLQGKDYYYRQRLGSIMNDTFNVKMLGYLEMVDRVELFFHEYYPSQIQYVYQKALIDYLGFASKIFIFSKNARYSKIYVGRIYQLAKKIDSISFLMKFLSKSKGRIECYIIFRHFIARSYFFLKKCRILWEERTNRFKG